MKEKLISLCKALDEKRNAKLVMTIGVDGFVDEVVHMVDIRHDFDSFDRIKTIASLGERISRAAGYSANIEMVPQMLKLGGNGPIYANALISYGVKLTYAGALGVQKIHDVFKDMAERAEKVYGLSEPGHTHCLEFEDGKLMLGKITMLNEITWEKFKTALGGPQAIAQNINKCDLFGMENWTMVPYMSHIWKGLIQEVFPLLEDRETPPIAFFDLADPEKRSKADILEAMQLIGKFDKKSKGKFRAILGLNEKELYAIADVFDIPKSGSMQETVTKVYESLNIYCLVVHPVKDACAITEEGFFHVDGPYCEKPVLTTGAGDNFNAGFTLGMSLGMSPQDSLTLGVCSSGFYVRNARSANYKEVWDFAEYWAEEGVI